MKKNLVSKENLSKVKKVLEWGLAPEQVKNSHKKFFTCSRAWYKRLFSCF